MNRFVSGLGTVVVVAALVVAGLWGVIDTYIVESTTTYMLPTLGTLAVAFGFVFVLFVLGAKSDRWIRSPYW
ncbi:hypothetical protein [Natronosalvus vescus]|uniref:hypothetical protein n=1 Tax=Natronosalvus vescus TaxID=2953881 RepID=UPI0020918864|nr:hypothetical protein [Natronosalvus vescus]